MLNVFYPLRNVFIVCVKIHIKPEISDAINTAKSITFLLVTKNILLYISCDFRHMSNLTVKKMGFLEQNSIKIHLCINNKKNHN
jgi:hypothetical protein